MGADLGAKRRPQPANGHPGAIGSASAPAQASSSRRASQRRNGSGRSKRSHLAAERGCGRFEETPIDLENRHPGPCAQDPELSFPVFASSEATRRRRLESWAQGHGCPVQLKQAGRRRLNPRDFLRRQSYRTPSTVCCSSCAEASLSPHPELVEGRVETHNLLIVLASCEGLVLRQAQDEAYFERLLTRTRQPWHKAQNDGRYQDKGGRRPSQGGREFSVLFLK